MRSLTSAALLASLCVADSAAAEVNTRIVWQVSLDGSTWQGGEVVRQPGASYQVRAVVSYTGTASPVGLASFVFQPVVKNWEPGSTLSPFVNAGEGGNTSTPLGVVAEGGPGFGRVSPWGRTALGAANALQGHLHDLQGPAPTPKWLRIAQRQATAWIGGTGNTTGGAGVPISQLSNVGRTSADPAFNSQLQNIVVFRMGLDFGTWLTPEIVIDSPVEGFGNRNAATGEREVYWFASMTEVTGSIRGTAVVEPVRLVIPGPGVVPCVVFGLAAFARRRRDTARVG